MGLWDTTKEFGAYLVDSGANVIGVSTTFAADQYLKDNIDPATGKQSGIVDTPATNADFSLGVTGAEQKTLREQRAQIGSIVDKVAGILGIGAGILIAGLAVGGVVVAYFYLGAPKRKA